MLISVIGKYPKTKKVLKFLSDFGQMTEMSQRKGKLRIPTKGFRTVAVCITTCRNADLGESSLETTTTYMANNK